MRFIKKFSLILFMIALLAFGAFIGYRFSLHHQKTATPQTMAEHVDNIVDEATDDLQNLFSPSPPPKKESPKTRKNDTKTKAKKNKSDIIGTKLTKNKPLDIPSSTNKENSDDTDMLGDDVPDTQDLVGSDFSDNSEKKQQDIQKDNDDDMLSNNEAYGNDRLGLDFSNDNNSDEEKEKSKQPSSQPTDGAQKNTSDLDLPTIETQDIDKLLTDNSNSTSDKILADEDISLENDNDSPFDDDEVSDDAIYNMVTSGEAVQNNSDEDMNDNFVQNTPEAEKETDNPDMTISEDISASTFEDDIFSNSDILETDKKDDVNPNDIFSSPSLQPRETKKSAQKEDLNPDDILEISPLKNDETEKTASPDVMPETTEAIDPDVLKQIDMPNDLYMPDERQLAKTPIMIEPTGKISEEAEQNITDDLFPSEAETEAGSVESEIIETNKALAAKNDPNTINNDITSKDDLFAGDDILSDVTGDKTGSQEDMSDLDPSADENNADMDIIEDDQTIPLTTETNPDLARPSGLQDTKDLSPEEKIAITPFTSMQASSATCRFEHVIDAHKMSEQFRLTVLPPNGDVPLKMEMIQDLSLDKFLTMKMDEVDGYPDSFSSLEVFCKEMTVSKRLIENY